MKAQTIDAAMAVASNYEEGRLLVLLKIDRT